MYCDRDSDTIIFGPSLYSNSRNFILYCNSDYTMPRYIADIPSCLCYAIEKGPDGKIYIAGEFGDSGTVAERGIYYIQYENGN
jgi:hypothetical protein